MADLSDLFNSPPGPPPRRSPPRRSLPPDSPPTPQAGPSRSNNPLFLSPGSAFDSPRRAVPAQRRPRSPDFNSGGAPPDPTDFDDDDFGRPAPNPSAQRVRDGSPGRAIDDFEEVLDPFAAIRNVDDEEGAPKKRRVTAKIDPDRLLGDDGITKLMKAAKRFKVKGKGREADDLKELLNVYQLWAHGMFPKGDFVGTMTRVETVCRTRRMENAIKGYRDAFYPRPRTPTPPRRSISPTRRSHSPTPAARPKTKSPSQAREPSPDATALFGTKEPLFASLGEEEMEEEDDGPDFEELRAMEEMENTTDKPNGNTSQGHDAGGMDVPEEEDEYGGLYD